MNINNEITTKLNKLDQLSFRDELTNPSKDPVGEFNNNIAIINDVASLINKSECDRYNGIINLRESLKEMKDAFIRQENLRQMFVKINIVPKDYL